MGYGFALFAATPPEVIRASAREAEALGYDSFWVNHPGPVDGLASLAPAARRRRASRSASASSRCTRAGPRASSRA
jgi:hypothetical protein